MKRSLALILAGQFLAMALASPVVHAQTAASVDVGASSGYGYAAPAQAVSSGPAIIASPLVPIVPPVNSGFIEFNNLIVESVSGTNPSAEIVASNPIIYPMMGASSAGSGVGIPATLSVAPSTASSASCYKFETQNSAAGTAVTCPTPPATPSIAPSTQPAPSPASRPNTAVPMIYPPTPTYPVYQPYRIEVGASTNLMLNDRTVATLSSFSSGDQINVFGYYNSDGSIQAYLIRDLSKPAQDEFLQLNNVELVSISTSTNPTTLVVAQAQGYPCYGFGVSGTAKQSIACPLGAPATSNNPALQNLAVPAALAPNWQLLRKYVINIDAQTIILDSNRTNLSLSDLQVGDQLNVYGDTTNKGQTLDADIVRDLSVPATPSTYNGTITQVNADGSFVIQTGDGQTITVRSPIQVGATVQSTGFLDRLTNVLSQVSDINFDSTAIYNILPVPATVPGMLRVQGSAPLPAGAGGTPNTQN